MFPAKTISWKQALATIIMQDILKDYLETLKVWRKANWQVKLYLT